MCDDCAFFRVDSDVDSCWSGVSFVSVVSSHVWASCDTEICLDELCVCGGGGGGGKV